VKKIIICEGFNDGIFITQLFERLGIQKNEVKLFRQEDVSLNEKKDAESKALKTFMSGGTYNPKKYLVKLEGGKHSATKILCRELKNCLQNIEGGLILLLDIDNSNAVKEVSDIIKKIKQNYSATTPLSLDENKKKKNDHLHHSSIRISIAKTNEHIGDFQIVLFSKSLEHSCKIEDTHTTEQRERLISSFIEKEKIVEFFNEIIK